MLWNSDFYSYDFKVFHRLQNPIFIIFWIWLCLGVTYKFPHLKSDTKIASSSSVIIHPFWKHGAFCQYVDRVPVIYRMLSQRSRVLFILISVIPHTKFFITPQYLVYENKLFYETLRQYLFSFRNNTPFSSCFTIFWGSNWNTLAVWCFDVHFLIRRSYQDRTSSKM